MNKDEFLLAMEKALASLPANERIDILGDYMEHFRAGEEEGKTDQEIAESLGDPAELSKSYLDGRETAGADEFTAPVPPQAPPVPPPASSVPPYEAPPQNPAASPYGVPSGTAPAQGPAYYGGTPPVSQVSGVNQSLAVVLVILFNVFVGVPLGFGLLMGLFGIAMGAVALLVGAIGLFIASAPAFALSGMAGGTVICGGIALLALCVLMAVAVASLIRVAVIGVSKYTRFCGRICREGRWPS